MSRNLANIRKNTPEKVECRVLDSDQRGSESKLILTQGGKLIYEYLIKGECFTIGRGEDNDIQLPDKKVSRVHARILTNLEGNLIEDLNSTNGTFINAKRISEHILQNGDVIKIGKYGLSYQPSSDSSLSQSKNADTKVSQLESDNFITKKKRVPVDITALDFEITSIGMSQTNAQQSVTERAGKVMDSSSEKISRKQELEEVLKTLEDLLD
ncbi:MAG: FHA domain-containing protein [Gammaproteobacteria bacterium]|nr:FHA domain-containing protein [Gammaproteobacteria bacterium]